MPKPALKLVPLKPRAKSPTSVGIVGQIRTALKRDNRLATTCGAAIGGFVPGATFSVAHNEIIRTSPLWEQPKVLLVLGGLLFSALTVAIWARLAFNSRTKAFGFTVLIEGVMTFSSQAWLSHLALVYLMLINAIATGVILSKQR